VTSPVSCGTMRAAKVQIRYESINLIRRLFHVAKSEVGFPVAIGRVCFVSAAT
jgi:hypothetical protein